MKWGHLVLALAIFLTVLVTWLDSTGHVDAWIDEDEPKNPH